MPGGATPTETLGDVGEFGLIQRIRRLFPGTEPTVVHGIGDDVAVVRTDSDHLLLVTCDCQIEGVHFLRHALNFWDLGWRAASVNLSDLAAMGGEPLWAVVSLMAPAELPVKAVEDLYRGMADALRPWQATVVGGNTARHPDRLVVDVTLLGRARPDGIVTRDGARPGDVIVVTGTLGGARAGLEWARGRVAGDAPEVRKQAMARYRTPRARVAEGKALAATGRVRAMLDVSDGLLGDLRHLCQASGVGALVEAACIPVDPCCRQTALSVGADPLEWALRGGEDYELLFSVDRQGGVGQVMEALGAVSDVAFAVIGWIVPREAGIQVVFPDGTRRSLTAEGGWDHFGSRPDK
ncbi:thiamine-monophosphate kinase [Desulfacinum hydrothermale DSM 13146]|uniref:Thiamine-monophosphate kinase n=1 Tax=Desulfacinum hydrothermale DSM 13146 TaxID=1121390 RepID=A0A1W1XV08_9BACT|nr:thiamine-phosphate kinase [Desulfacinum hydrothermale]SMC27692.1 thiamine-monophosphate kinase [Desulfacinum hydrothermale DSM 13146]